MGEGGRREVGGEKEEAGTEVDYLVRKLGVGYVRTLIFH